MLGETDGVVARKPTTPRVLSARGATRLLEFWTIESRLLDSLGMIRETLDVS